MLFRGEKRNRFGGIVRFDGLDYVYGGSVEMEITL